MLGQSKLIADALFVIRRVHVVGDKLLDVSRSLNLSLTGLQRELDDVHGNEVRNLTDACEGRVERTVSQVVFRHHIGAGVSQREESFEQIGRLLDQVLENAFQINNVSHELEKEVLYQRDTTDSIRQIIEFLYAVNNDK